MNKATERAIEQVYSMVFNKIYNKTRLAKLAKGLRIEILKAASTLSSSSVYNEFAKKFSVELAKKGLNKEKGLWRKYYRAAKKLGYIALDKTWTQFEAEQLAKAVRHNFDLIKSIPTATLKILEHKYTSTLIEEVAKGKLTRGSFERQLKSHGHKNAKLIARTESAKLQTAITENRAKDLGSVAYIWKSSNDKRTRPSHKQMNGVVVLWRNSDLEKPLLDGMYGHAGEFPNCRCDPQPIFDETDLDKSRYNLYDYREHKIINVSKKELLDILEKGYLT